MKYNKDPTFFILATRTLVKDERWKDFQAIRYSSKVTQFSARRENKIPESYYCTTFVRISGVLSTKKFFLHSFVYFWFIFSRNYAKIFGHRVNHSVKKQWMLISRFRTWTYEVRRFPSKFLRLQDWGKFHVSSQMKSSIQKTVKLKTIIRPFSKLVDLNTLNKKNFNSISSKITAVPCEHFYSI